MQKDSKAYDDLAKQATHEALHAWELVRLYHLAIQSQKEEIERLKAEVERLTNLQSGADYFKAKEGKQS